MSSLSERDSDQRSERPPAEVRSAGLLRRVGDDLRRGRNVELYVTVMLALCIALLSVLTVVGSQVVSATTLAVLALLAVSGLATRHQSEEAGCRIEQLAANLSGEVPADRFLKTRMPALDEDVATAADICLVGVTLTRTVRDLLPVLDRRLRKGASIRVLVIDVDSPARAEAVARSRSADSPDFYQNRIRSTSICSASSRPLRRMIPRSSYAFCHMCPRSACASSTQPRHTVVYTLRSISTRRSSRILHSASELTATALGTSSLPGSLKRSGIAPGRIH